MSDINIQLLNILLKKQKNVTAAQAATAINKIKRAIEEMENECKQDKK